MNGISLTDNFLHDPAGILNYLLENVNWDERMNIRKTASYGVAYNYSQMSYPFQPMLLPLEQICKNVNPIIGFLPNNCLINYYPDGKSKMGYHADQTDILAPQTGVAIISLGATRVLKFRNILNHEQVLSYELKPGSLFYMTQAIQAEWEHAIPKTDTDEARISITLRQIIS